MARQEGWDLHAVATNLGGKVSERKLRLLACACVRQVWHLLVDERSRRAVESLEAVADGQEETIAHSAAIVRGLDVVHVYARAGRVRALTPEEWRQWHAAGAVSILADDISLGWPTRGEEMISGLCRASNPGGSESLAALFHDVVGDNLRQPAGREGWERQAVLTPTVLSLAQAAYDDRSEGGVMDLVALCALADALEEAGYSSDEKCPSCRGEGSGWTGDNISVPVDWWECERCVGTGSIASRWLTHLRSPGPHVRGCWAVDCILGRE